MKMDDSLSTAVMPQLDEGKSSRTFAHLDEWLLIELLGKLLYAGPGICQFLGIGLFGGSHNKL